MKYLFTAVFEGKDQFKQASNDVSVLDANRSSFYDVLERSKIQKLTAFFLEGEDKIFGVDLESGTFFINGSWLSLNSKEYKGADLRIIYYRDNSQLFMVGENLPKTPIQTIFCIGFQTNDENGQNTKQILQIFEDGSVNFLI